MPEPGSKIYRSPKSLVELVSGLSLPDFKKLVLTLNRAELSTILPLLDPHQIWYLWETLIDVRLRKWVISRVNAYQLIEGWS
jgi:hypothetical protein